MTDVGLHVQHTVTVTVTRVVSGPDQYRDWSHDRNTSQLQVEHTWPGTYRPNKLKTALVPSKQDISIGQPYMALRKYINNSYQIAWHYLEIFI